MILQDYKTFLTKTNAFALAIGVIAGAATQKLVSAIVDDLVMPLVSLMLPAGDWRDAQIVLSQSHDVAGKITVSAIKYGNFFGDIIDFLVVSLVVFFVTKLLLKSEADQSSKQMRSCPECLETIPVAARKCRACTSIIEQ